MVLAVHADLYALSNSLHFFPLACASHDRDCRSVFPQFGGITGCATRQPIATDFNEGAIRTFAVSIANSRGERSTLSFHLLIDSSPLDLFPSYARTSTRYMLIHIVFNVAIFVKNEGMNESHRIPPDTSEFSFHFPN